MNQITTNLGIIETIKNNSVRLRKLEDRFLEKSREIEKEIGNFLEERNRVLEEYKLNCGGIYFGNRDLNIYRGIILILAKLNDSRRPHFSNQYDRYSFWNNTMGAAHKNEGRWGFTIGSPGFLDFRPSDLLSIQIHFDETSQEEFYSLTDRKKKLFTYAVNHCVADYMDFYLGIVKAYENALNEINDFHNKKIQEVANSVHKL
jgi:hypothetical protein